MNVSDLWTPRQFTLTNGSTTVPKRLSIIGTNDDVDIISYSGTTVTITLLTVHQLRTGDMVSLTGAWNNAEVIGKFKVTVLNTLAFTITVNKAPTAAINGAAGSCIDLLYSFATATVLGQKAARVANTGLVWLGVTSANSDQPYQVNVYNPTTQDGIVILGGGNPEHRWKLSDWYLDVATANDGVVMTMK